MATIVAVRSGNWSDTSHVTGPWPGASTPTTKPGVDDTVQSGAFIVTIDEDVTVALLEAVSTGYFEVTSAPSLPVVRTITANVLSNRLGEGALKISNPSGKVVLIGDINVAANRNTYAIYNTGVMGNITGDLTAGNVDGAWAVYNNGTIGDITGDMTAGDANSAWAVHNNGGTIGDITGDLTAGNVGGAFAVYNGGGGTIGDIDGSLICGATGQFPIFGPFRLVANPANNVTFCQPNGNPWTLSNDYPAPADVRSGVEYDRGTQTGEMAAGGSIGPVSIVIGGGGIRIF